MICARCNKRFFRSIALNDASDPYCSRKCQEADEAAFDEELAAFEAIKEVLR